jgi:serine kinase of HPr protein (carbohydrate metabolism regulator)
MTDNTLHASCVVVREAGILIRGSSGAGKSLLARELLLDAERRGRFARLVCDDRVRVANRNGRLVAQAVPAIAGKLEARGFGALTLDHEGAAVVRGLIDCLTEDPPRLPEQVDETTDIAGVRLPRLVLRMGPESSGFAVLWIETLHASFTNLC